MRRFPGITWWGALLSAGWLLASLPGCAASDVTSCTSLSCGPSDQTDGGTIVPMEVGTSLESAPPVDSGPSRSLLCGTTGCFPGNRSACGVNPSDAAGFYDPFADADAGESATSDAQEGGSTDAASDASMTEASADAASTSDAPDDVGSSDEPRVSQSCYIQRAEAGSGVATQCGPVGSVPEGGECQDSHDCVALNACVEIDGKGVCRPVSCALPIICPPGSFYQEEKLRIGGTNSGFAVPVCLPNDHCMLLSDPNPCNHPGEVCAVVGSQGETSCIEPGPGKQGDDCDETPTKRCGNGLLCSKFNNQCVRLCHVSADVNECGGGICQGGNKSIPEGFGICVGEIPDASR
jgi:hypothetical protein